MRLQLYTYDDLFILARAILSQATGVEYSLNPGTLHAALVSVSTMMGASASAQTVNLIRGSSLEGTTQSLLDRRGLEEGVPRQDSTPSRAQGRMFPADSPAAAAYTAPAGTTVIRPATATQSEIAFTLEASAVIPNGGTQSNLVSVVCTDRGTRSNDIAASTALDLKYPINGIDSFVLASATGGGTARQTDAEYRKDIRAARKTNNEGSWAGIETLLKTVKLDSGSRVTVARLFEDFPNRQVLAILDDGSGVATNVAPIDTTTYDIAGYPSSTYWEYNAGGGEIYVQLPYYHLPQWNATVDADIRHWDGSSWTLLTHNTDYYINIDTGKIAFASALGVGDQLRVWFQFYTGLVGLASRYLNGVRGSATEKGWRHSGNFVRLRGPYTSTVPPVTADIHFDEGYDSTFGRELAAGLVLTYLNGLDIAEAARYNVINSILSKAPGVSYIDNLLVDAATVDIAPTNPYGVVRGSAATITV